MSGALYRETSVQKADRQVKEAQHELQKAQWNLQDAQKEEKAEMESSTKAEVLG